MVSINFIIKVEFIFHFFLIVLEYFYQFFFKNEFFDYRPLTFKEIIPFHLSSDKLFIEKSSLLFFFLFI